MNKTRVIIADSSQNLLEGIRGLLETFFDYVVMVADIDSLIDTARRLESDMVVLDLSLGKNKTLDAVKTIRKHFPDIKILIMSIFDEPVARKKALSEGADGFVLKREAGNDLIPAVKAILKGGTFVSAIKEPRN